MECGVSGVTLVIVQSLVGVELRSALELALIPHLSLVARIVLATPQKVKIVGQTLAPVRYCLTLI